MDVSVIQYVKLNQLMKWAIAVFLLRGVKKSYILFYM